MVATKTQGPSLQLKDDWGLSAAGITFDPHPDDPATMVIEGDSLAARSVAPQPYGVDAPL